MDVTPILTNAYRAYLGRKVNEQTWVALWAEYNLQRASEPDLYKAATRAAQNVKRDGL